MTARPQLVIFELDGALTDSASGIVSSFSHAVAQVGEPVPGDPDLAGIAAAGVRLAVPTSKSEPIARKILAHFGLDDHFEVIAGASPDGVRATKADVSRVDADRSHDLHGASHHCIETVMVEWGYRGLDFDDPTVERPLTHVSTVAALREVLGV